MASERVEVVRRIATAPKDGSRDRSEIHPDIEFRTATIPGVWWALGTVRGADELQTQVNDPLGDWFDEFKVRVDGVLDVEDGRVLLLARHTGTTRTGRKLDSPLMQLWTVTDGKAVLIEDFPDTAAWVAALTD